MELSIPKIKMLAVLLVLGSGEVFAQSSVTLYGNLDTGLYYQSRTVGSKGSEFGALDGGWFPSFFGFTGKEDLGGGLHAGFKLESGIDTTTGSYGNSNGNFFGRNAYVELGGGFGTVRAGMQFSPFFSTWAMLAGPGVYCSRLAIFFSFHSQ